MLERCRDRTPVRLRVWGLSEWDATRARQDATVEAAERDWEIVKVESSTGRPNPLRPRDYSALHIGERNYRAWAFYAIKPDENGDEADGEPEG